MVLQAAWSAPAPLGATLAMRALSATRVPMLAPKLVPLTQTDMRWAGEPCWSAPAHEVRARADPTMTRSRASMVVRWRRRRSIRGGSGGPDDVDVPRALAQHHVAVVQQVRGAQGAGGVALLHVVDVGPALLDGAPGLAPRLGQTGARQQVHQPEAAVEQLGPAHLRRRRVLGHGAQHGLAQPGD